MKSLLSVIFVLWFLFSNAQVPAGINYQAAVRDASGEVVSNRDVSLRISIIKDAKNGETVYSEVHRVTANNFGLVKIDIGRGESLTE